MGSVVALDTLIDERRVWRGQALAGQAGVQPTGHAVLDQALPAGGWPEAALSEILLPAEGMGELQLLWPTLARLTQARERIVLVAPPHVAFPWAWQAAGVDLRWMSIVRCNTREALWATEQCLRSGSCAAVLCWPEKADDRSLRRLQVAAETGQTLAFAYRSIREAVNPSPAALRLAFDGPGEVRVLKCRGGLAPARSITLAAGA